MNKVFGAFKVFVTDDETYDFYPDQMLGSEWNLIRQELDQTHGEFMRNVDRRDFISVQYLIWWLRFKAGKQQDRLSIDFPLMQFRWEEIPDPEGEAAGTTSAAATSTPSEPGSESNGPTGPA